METEPPVKSSFNRRKSVFAEHYDPEEEEDEEKLIYPKSDEQRKRLGEAVKNILLFRSLDQVSLFCISFYKHYSYTQVK